MSVVPMVWAMEVGGYFPASVSIYYGDGSVVVFHGGIEMGQGINTKVGVHRYYLKQTFCVHTYFVLSKTSKLYINRQS